MGCCVSPEQKADELVLRGAEALRARQIIEAKAHFTAAIQSFPVAPICEEVNSLAARRRSTRRLNVGLPAAHPLMTTRPLDGETNGVGPSHGATLGRESTPPTTSASVGAPLFPPQDRDTVDAMITVAETRALIGATYLDNGYRTLAEEQYEQVVAAHPYIEQSTHSIIQQQRLSEVWCRANIGLAAISLAEAKACNNVQPTFDYMCKKAALHCEQASTTISDIHGPTSPELIPVLELQTDLHMVTEEYTLSVASCQRCLGIVTRVHGVKSVARQRLLQHLGELKTKLPESDMVVNNLC